MNSTQQDLYAILEVPKDATIEEIKKSYKKLAMKYHPDKNPNDKEAEEKFKEIANAYEILSDPARKNNYDNPGFGGWSNMGGGMYTSKKVHIPMDIQKIVNINLSDIFAGEPLDITYKRHVMCQDCAGIGFTGKPDFDCPYCQGTGQFHHFAACGHCNGTGKYYSPEKECKTCKGYGVQPKDNTITIDISKLSGNTNYRLDGYGNYSDDFEVYGTLILLIRITIPENYILDKSTIYHKLNVHYEDAINGGEIEYKHLDGKTYKLKIKPGTFDEELLKMSGMGLINSIGLRDNLIHKVNIIIDYDRLKKEKEKEQEHE